MAKIYMTNGSLVDIPMRRLVGRKVRTRRALQNNHMTLEAGSIFVVTSTWRSGVSMSGPTCACCGVTPVMLQIHRTAVELFPEEAN